MLITIETSKLNEDAFYALAAGAKDVELLKKLYTINNYDLHKIIIENHHVDGELVRIIYQKYLTNESMVRLIFLNEKTPEDIIIDILEHYKERFKNEFGWVGHSILYNENITEKTIRVLYYMRKSGEVQMQRNTFERFIEDERTGVDVLKDILDSNPNNDMLCIIARHPKMKIVPASE